ncbi:MAG: hypothetical protein KDA88_10370 [Planctomycetaceae bacterium]|nr:hypothetical protein [Planctomycetaceae bacterium]MCB9950704.1 hypothetical protein [Planctomycetaceae bacterium]
MRRVVSLALIAVLSLTVFQLLNAQEKNGAAEVKERRGPLPAMYGQLGMSDEQKEQAYDVMAKYDAEIDRLKEEMKLLLAERNKGIQALLTDGQKLRLKELQAAARKKAGVKESANDDAPAAPAE